MEFSRRKTIPDATSEASEVRRGKMAAASSSAAKYGYAGSATCMYICLNRDVDTYEAVSHKRGSDNGGGNRVHPDAVGSEEVGHAAGNTEDTGCRMVSLGSELIQVKENLTLSRSVRKATGRNWACDGRGNVDDAAPLLRGTWGKRPFVGVLAVDGIGDNGVNGEGTVCIHVKHLGEVLTHC